MYNINKRERKEKSGDDDILDVQPQALKKSKLRFF